MWNWSACASASRSRVSESESRCLNRRCRASVVSFTTPPRASFQHSSSWKPASNRASAVISAVARSNAALAGYTMVKFFGVIFLGQPREEKLVRAHDADRWERAGMLWLAAGCVALGLAPVQFIAFISPITHQLVGAGLADAMAGSGWLLAPTSAERASYGPVIFLLGVTASFALAFGIVRRFYHGRLRRAPAWDCGYPWQGARMQDTAEGFGQPVREIFGPFFRLRRELPSPFDARPRYRVTIEDHFWHWLYLPVVALAERIARVVGLMQQGRIGTYLLYSFVTLLVTLLVVKR